MKRMKTGKQLLAAALAALLAFGGLPTLAWADSLPAQNDGLCEHHPAHSADECKFEKGQPCGHEHTADCYTKLTCGYEEAAAGGGHEETAAGSGYEETATGSDAGHKHTADCFAPDCAHERGEHDGSCGYVKAHPCEFHCAECKEEGQDGWSFRSGGIGRQESKLSFANSSAGFGANPTVGYSVVVGDDLTGAGDNTVLSSRISVLLANDLWDDRPTLNIQLTGEDAESFRTSKTSIEWTNPEGDGYYEHFYLYPLEGLPAGRYQVNLTVSAAGAGSASMTGIEFGVNGIVADPASIDFGNYSEGYTVDESGESQGGNNEVVAKELNIEVYQDDGSSSHRFTIIADRDFEDSFEVSSNSIIGVSGSYNSVLVYPKSGLENGSYEGIIEISGGDMNDLEIPVRFTVGPRPGPFVAVSDITVVSDQMEAGKMMTLSGKVWPLEATYRDIVWTVLKNGDTGAALSQNGALTCTSSGVVTVRATVEGGTQTGSYTKDFNIYVFDPDGGGKCGKGVRAKWIDKYAVASSNEKPSAEKLAELLIDDYKYVNSYSISGTLTGQYSEISFPANGVKPGENVAVLRKGANGWEKLPSRAIKGRISCFTTGLSSFAVYSSTSVIQPGGNSGGGSIDYNYDGLKPIAPNQETNIVIPWSEGSGTWVKSGETGWKFLKSGGGYATAECLIINGQWYYFSADGLMLTGWQYINEIWYCFKEDGSMITGWYYDPVYKEYFYLDKGGMVTGWRYIDGEYYYFNPVSDGTKGSMAKNAQIGEWNVGENGARTE